MNWSDLWRNYAWMLPALIVLLFSCGVLAGIARLARRRAAGFSVPRPPSQPLVRWGETILWLFAGGLLLMWLSWGYDDWVRNPDSVPAVRAGVQRRLLYAAAVIAGVVLAAIARRQWLAALGFVAVMMGMSADWQPVYEWPDVVAEVRNSPVPFTFATPPDLPPVSVTVNDVPVGTTPVITTWEDLKARTPNWEMRPEFHNQRDRGTLLRGPFHVTTMGVPGDGAAPDEKQLFLRYHLGDQPLYAIGTNTFQWSGFARTTYTGIGWFNQGMRVHAQIMPFRIEQNLTLAAWGDEVLQLLHRARLADYAVDDPWCTALESYTALGETALIGLRPGDPALQTVADTLARRRYPWLSDTLDEHSAWQHLIDLIDVAGVRGEIWMTGVDGSAVRQIARQIPDEAFAKRVAEVLAVPVVLPGTSVATSHLAGEVTQFRITPHDDRRQGHWMRERVLQQLAIERDAALDAASPEPDNPIEVYVTPVLMRRGGRVGDGAETRIGGHMYAQVLYRHNWRNLHPDPSGSWEDTEHIYGATINRWLVRLAELQSPFGREFRRHNHEELLRLAKEIWSGESFSMNLPEKLDFLFLDHHADFPANELKRQTLAQSFRKEFLQRHSSDKRTDLKNQWTYLARMAPDSKPEEFVRALDDINPEWLDSSVGECLKQMPPAFAVEVLQTVLEHLEKLSASGKYPASPREYVQDRSILIGEALGIVHSDMADIIFEELDRKDSRLAGNRLLPDLAEGRVPLMTLQKLATCDRPTIRKLVAESGLYRTDPASRRLIEQLATDADESVRTAAQAILKQWAEWKARPLPSRRLPVAAAAG